MISLQENHARQRRCFDTPRRHAPVFVVGCARSGTTLLYHMLLSAGGFAYYRAETHVFNLLVPRFGNLRSAAARQKLMDVWLDSMFFRRSGLDAEEIRAQVVDECRSGGDFLLAVMGGIARRQGVERWSDCTPNHVLHMREIKKAIPEALFVHVIRDGRDAALSLDRTGWVSTFPWDRKRSLLVAGLQWEWTVSRGCRAGQALDPDYLEISFEDLVSEPQETLRVVGAFIDHDLDYDRILQNPVGSVIKPNTSFAAEAQQGAFNPVGRWKQKLSSDQLAVIEKMIGKTLTRFGYEPNSTASAMRSVQSFKLMRASYRTYYSTKHWAKVSTPLGRVLTDIDVFSS